MLAASQRHLLQRPSTGDLMTIREKLTVLEFFSLTDSFLISSIQE